MSKVVIFDMDGVLFDTERLYRQCWTTLDTTSLKDIDEVLKACIGSNEQKTQEIFRTHYGENFDFNGYHARAKEVFQKHLKEQGMPMKEGVYELLEYLKKADYKIGLASSTRTEIVKEELEAAKIAQYFDVIVGGDQVKESKPNPEIFLYACEKLGEKPEKAMVVEDSLNGIRAAYAAGMKPIMVPDLVLPTEEIEALLYYKFESLLEVRDFLRSQG